ncbi:TetR/AcrR family transcriptional regulator [Microterricola pindariensis]|uniref:TetR family transcriptional regulator n=1 Tax=Microterricola pindariensis TaxID=478010 RepID=A0ABX5AV55_9MICO|nr:TetR/AcrR family transcriptional regulator [Microterricola pindariensis]PPL18783.1 TetR family transcriptional regulator [Microterricola pindariensis]
MNQPSNPTNRAPRGGNGRAGRVPYDLDAVLDIAVLAFNEFGYEATSMGVLAERLGTSKSAIYYHVTGKEDLLRRALERALGGLEGILAEQGAMDGSPVERLRYVLRGAVLVLADDLPYVTLLLRLRGNTEVEREALERRRAFDHAIAGLVDEARVEGALRADVDARTTVRLLFGMINSIVEWYKPGGALTPDQLAEDVITVAFEGVRVHAADAVPAAGA